MHCTNKHSKQHTRMCKLMLTSYISKYIQMKHFPSPSTATPCSTLFTPRTAIFATCFKSNMRIVRMFPWLSLMHWPELFGRERLKSCHLPSQAIMASKRLHSSRRWSSQGYCGSQSYSQYWPTGKDWRVSRDVQDQTSTALPTRHALHKLR